jgi:hypothetical protein
MIRLDGKRYLNVCGFFMIDHERQHVNNPPKNFSLLDGVPATFGSLCYMVLGYFSTL